ncbi:MAG: trigger factor, partial [Desulfohalobiaceae bacterium]|nr:trigger factor [Desulfohalobiaceae bacterium]
NSTLELVKEERHPQDGDVAVIDFAAYQNGQPLENIKQDKFELTLGQAQALSDFEAIVKGLLPGQSGEGEVPLPDDFINQDLAGQTVNMQVHLNVIKERILPAVDEELAQKVAGHGSVETLRKQIEDNYKGYFENMEKSRVQKKLLDQLSARTDFALPETMVERQLDGMLENKQKRLEQQGKSLEAEGTPEELKEKLRPEAEEMVKNHLILLEIAKKEDLNISPQEVDQYLYQTAIRNRQDPEQLKKHYEDNNLMFALKDSLLADRAAEVLYEKAEIQEIEPEESAEPKAVAETENPDESGSPDEEKAE